MHHTHPNFTNGETRRDFSSFPARYNDPSNPPPAYGEVGTTQFTSMEHPLLSPYNFYTWH